MKLRLMALLGAAAMLFAACGKAPAAPIRTPSSVVAGGANSSTTAESPAALPSSSTEQTVPSSSTESSSTEQTVPSSSVESSSMEQTAPSSSTEYSSEAAPQNVPAAPLSAMPELVVSAPSLALGEMLSLRVTNSADIPVSATSDIPFRLRFFPKDGDQIALLPISYNLTAGNYGLKVTAGDAVFNQTIVVNDRTFEVQNLTIDESVVGSTNTPDGNAQWQRIVEPLKQISAQEQYWQETFLYPVPSSQNITTEFGLQRYTNGSKTAVRHSGIDIAAPEGTPVLAANTGVVQFAGELILTGNTIVIEHGYGLKSLYYHMASLNVETGQSVEKGQQIGAVGSTGYSTGPHLHFAMAVNDVFVNPWTAFDTSVIPSQS